MPKKINLLFVCTANVCRSPLAAALFKQSRAYTARSCGVQTLGYPGAKAVTQKLIDWADEIFVMSENSDRHLTFLRSHFDLSGKQLHDLEIPNIYDTNILTDRKKLVLLLKDKLAPYIKMRLGGKISYADFLKTIAVCPFCDKTDRTISSNKHAYLTYALAPYHKHHLLVIPRRHVLTLTQLTKAEETDMMKLEKLGVKLLKKLHYPSATILIREGNARAKSVEHLHCHIIPTVRIGYLDHYGKPRAVMSKSEANAIMKEFTKIVRSSSTR